jgi:thiol-disulfide isomerase/thioredoxin
MNSRFCSPGKLLPYLFYLLLSFILMLCWRPVKAQTGAVRQLAIGDTVPDITIRNVLNYKTPTAQISDFRGKLLILDFWASWCSPCVQMVIRMDSLQKQFEDRVQFLAVSAEPASKVAAFRARHEKRHGKRIQHPEVVADTVLGKYFYHNAVPHYVWIGSDGVVKAITEMDQINAEKISAFLAGEQVKLAEKKDIKPIPYDKNRPFLAGGNGGDGSHLLYHSVLAGYTPGLSGGFSWNNDPKSGRRISATNVSRYWLYRIAYAKPGGFLDEGSVIIESSKPERITSQLYGQQFLQWLSDDNGFCYEIIVPAGMQEKTNGIMQRELTNLFPEFSALIEDRERESLVLSRLPGAALPVSTGGKKQISIDPFGWKAVNVTPAQVAERFNQSQNYALNMVDRTGHSAPVDIEIEGDLSDLTGFNSQLARYGMVLKKQVISRPMLVIRDNIQASK